MMNPSTRFAPPILQPNKPEVRELIGEINELKGEGGRYWDQDEWTVRAINARINRLKELGYRMED